MMKTVFNIVVILISIYSCASPQTIDGGDKDSKSPVEIKTNITEINFSEKTITIEFDEYIQLDNPSTNINIQPGVFNIKADVIKKKLIIRTDTSFKENTTYTIQSNNAIKDLNEGNIYILNKTFSTGPFKDTGTIKVNINNPGNFKELKIALLENLPKDSLKIFTPYINYSVTNNNISFNGLKKYTKYHIWIYTDKDNDKHPDLYSPINFINNIEADTTLNIKVEEWKSPFQIRKITTDGKYSKVYYNSNPHYHLYLYEIFGKQLEKALYYNEDSALVYNLKYDFITDTINTIDVKKELIGLIKKNMEITEGKNKYLITYDVPQSFQKKSEYSKILRNQFSVPNKIDSFFIDNPDKSISLLIYTKNINVIESVKKSYLMINIKNKENNVFDIKILKDTSTYKWIYDHYSYDLLLEPGNYKVEIYERSYLNTINPFTYKNNNQLLYSKSFILRASWEEIMEINID